MKKEVTLCDICGKQIKDETVNIQLRSIQGKPIYQDQSFIEYEYDMCALCGNDFPNMFKEFIEYKKSKGLSSGKK